VGRKTLCKKLPKPTGRDREEKKTTTIEAQVDGTKRNTQRQTMVAEAYKRWEWEEKKRP